MPDFEDKIPLSEFSVTNILHATDRVPLIQASGEDWDNFCAALLDIALWIVKDAEYTSAGLNTQSKKIIGAINEVAAQSGSVDITTEIDTPAPIMTFSDGGDNIPLKSLVTEIVPIQSGSGVPSPQNVRSISGLQNVNIYKDGKNIYPIDYSHASQEVSGITFSFNNDGSVEMTGRATANTYPYAVTFRLPAGTYKKSPAINDIGILVQYIASSSSWTLVSSATETEFTITEEISQYPIVARVRVPNGKVLDHYKYYPFIYVGSEIDLTFEKYLGTTVTIPLGQTVYGGNLECVKGEGVSDGVLIDLANYTGRVRAVGENENKYFRFEELADSPDLTKRALLLCDKFPLVEMSVNNTNIGVDIIEPSTLGYTVIAFRPPNVTSYTTQTVMDYIRTTLNGLQVCYRKATPTSISVTGANIPTLSGVNNVYTDCGDIQSLEYFNENGDDIASMVRLMTRT